MEYLEQVADKLRNLSTLNKGIILFVTYRFLRYLKWRRSITSRIPGPSPSLFLGNIMSFVKAGGFNDKLFMDMHSKHGPITAFFIGPTLCNVSVADAQLAKEVYRNTRDRPAETYMFLNYLGDDNLLFSRGEQTFKLRGAYQEMLVNEEYLEKVKDVTFLEVRKAVDQWTSAKGPTDIYPATGPMVYDILGKTLFNRAWLGTPEGDKIYALHSYLIEHVNNFLLLYGMPRWFRTLYSFISPGHRKYCKTIETLRNECATLLDERREAVKNGEFAGDTSALTLLTKNELFKNNKHLAVTTMIGFLNGSYDTTHATMVWLLYHMAKYPEKAEKLYNEVQQEVGRSGTPDMQTLKRMEYVNAFLKESMRMVAIVPVNQRVNLAQEIEIGGIKIPKGMTVNIANGAMFRDEKYFGPNTDMFIPERFIGQSESARLARNSILAFGGWTRICAGLKFAENAELPAFIVSVMQKATVHLDDPNEKGTYDVEAGVNQPFPKFKLRFEKRKVFPTW